MVAAIVFGAVGGGAAQSATVLDLSTSAAIDSYLVSKGVDPASVMRQSGRYNYAGPSCPGKGWTCTTATKVVQVAPAGGQNVADCGAASRCTFVQTGPAAPTGSENNVVRCVRKDSTEPTAVQSCTVAQAYARNHAIVQMTITQSKGPIQDATQTADVTQEGLFNELQLRQDVRQTTKSAAQQTQDVHQIATVEQTASGSGNNYSHVHQTHDQKASGAATSQLQDTSGTTSDCVPNVFPDDPTQPNVCANVRQTTETGKNESHLHQTVGESATSTVTASQQQGSAGGGSDAGIHQETNAPGSSNNHALQDKRQRLSAPSGSQTQYDPTRCCVASQVGGVNDKEDINQSVTQSATDSSAFQFAKLIGASLTPGRCDITHRARQNDGSTAFSISESNGCALLVVTTCVSGGSESTAAQTQAGPCTTDQIDLEPPCIDCLTAVPSTATLASTPTFGLPIDMPDYTSEPSSYTTAP